jgi:predicted acylesterase/phospholipase RssA
MHAESSTPRDRYCDLVMKGGITSGIVYPKAISALAQHYRFKNIGGTSAGAIAAAVTAAAEYQRRCTNSMGGFILLDGRPEELSASKKSDSGTKLLSLFQPQNETRRLFRVLSIALNKKTLLRRVISILGGIVVAYWPAVVTSLIGSLLFFHFAGVAASILSFILFFLSLISFMVFHDVTERLVKNRFGLCTGMPTAKDSPESVTTWLHRSIQQAAGRTIDDPPLTFGDLWNCHGAACAELGTSHASDEKAINLQMFTTSLTHGRPYILPLSDPSERLFFRPEELKDYLPDRVLECITKQELESKLMPGLYEFPPAADFPVLFAARLSLSFPILFSAVPLWALYDKHNAGTDKKSTQIPMRCWFSDGGLSSNFPMHLFDGLVPRWPTFGIQLEDKIPDLKELVYLPQLYDEGYGESWDHFEGDRPRSKENGKLIKNTRSAASRCGGFLRAVVHSMQNWNDNCLSRMPGVRDRVVHVRLKEKEGGLNLNMPKKLVEDVSSRGKDAADKLIERFLPAAGSSLPASPGWDEHRWIRLNVLIEMLEDRLPTIDGAFAPPHSTNLSEIIRNACLATPAGRSRPLNLTEEKELGQILDTLSASGKSMARFSRLYDFEARPRPELRVRPPL